MHRGVVLCPTYSIEGRNVHLTTEVPSQDLRRYLLYWDRLAYAFPNGFGKPNLEALPDLQFLIDAGLLSLRDVTLAASDVDLPPTVLLPNLAGHPGPLFDDVDPTEGNPSGVRALGMPIETWRDLNYWAPFQAAKDLQITDGAPWSVAQTGSNFSLPTSKEPRRALLEASLGAALPVPDEDTPLQDILEFKEKRAPEILRLRRALDQLRDEALRSEDLYRGIARSRDEISLALFDIYRTLDEGGIRTFFSTLRLYLDVSDNKLTTAALGAIGAQGLGFPPELGALAGMALNASLTFATRTVAPPPPLAQQLSDFRYLYDVAKQWPSARA